MLDDCRVEWESFRAITLTLNTFRTQGDVTAFTDDTSNGFLVFLGQTPTDESSFLGSLGVATLNERLIARFRGVSVWAIPTDKIHQ
jgi:hypothetical protein